MSVRSRLPLKHKQVVQLFRNLDHRPIKDFPPKGSSTNASTRQGVYVLRNAARRVVHIGRTYRGKSGIRQRLCDHLNGTSSFARHYLKPRRLNIRKGFTFQYLVVANAKTRALLENYATASHCPVYLGLHKKELKSMRSRRSR